MDTLSQYLSCNIQTKSCAAERVVTTVTVVLVLVFFQQKHVCCQRKPNTELLWSDFFCCVAVYKSPQYESMGFRLVVDRLISIGYPEAIREFEYDHSFPVRSV